jgi:hypothetical protein
MIAALESAELARSRGGLPEVNSTTYYGPPAVDAWFLMGGEIHWDAIPALVELLGIDDVEMMIHGLVEIREHFRRQRDAQTNH